MLRASVLLGVVLAISAGASWAATEEKRDHVIAYHEDKLTVHVQGAPLRKVLDEIGQKTGAEIRGEVVNPQDVTVEFDDVPLIEGLQRLLRDQNFAMSYGDEGRLRSIELLGGPLGAPEKGAVAVDEFDGGKPRYRPKPWPPENVKPSADALWSLFTDPRELQVSGRLAEALGTKRATFKQIAFAAAHEEDPAVRSRAMLTGLNVIESDPALRDAFAVTLQSLGDDDIAHALRQFAGDHAEEWVARFARHSRQGDLRTRAAPVLQELSTLGPEK